MNSSRRTSRHPPQPTEIALNSDSIQAAAALIPSPAGRSVSMLESVFRVLKLTSFVISARTWSGEMVCSAAAIAGSAWGTAIGCWASLFPVKTAAASAAVPRNRLICISAPLGNIR
jgi:hypothetical protein